MLCGSEEIQRLIRLCEFLAKTDYPLYGDEADLREWCEVMHHYNVELDLPEINSICKGWLGYALRRLQEMQVLHTVRGTE